jgi:hypothetical protein
MPMADAVSPLDLGGRSPRAHWRSGPGESAAVVRLGG